MQTVFKIYLHRIAHNLSYYKAKLKPKTKVMAMVKANGYGMGMVELSQFLQDKVDYLGVAYTNEAVALRRSGIQVPILVLNPPLDSFQDLITYQLEPAIHSLKQLQALKAALHEQEFEGKFPIQIELETGMNRLGFKEEEIAALLKVLALAPELRVKSVFSHFASAGTPSEKGFTLSQVSAFDHMCQILSSELRPFEKHIANSDAVSWYEGVSFDMVRLGLTLFGISSNKDDDENLQPAAHLIASVSQVKKLEKGDTVSYGRLFEAQNNMTIAVISIGYGSGYRRALGNGVGKVFIRGKHCPTVGAVCMDMMMVDVSHLSQIEEGDEVEIVGENITLNHLAEWEGTIPYEVLTNISIRVKREYIDKP